MITVAIAAPRTPTCTIKIALSITLDVSSIAEARRFADCASKAFSKYAKGQEREIKTKFQISIRRIIEERSYCGPKRSDIKFGEIQTTPKPIGIEIIDTYFIRRPNKKESSTSSDLRDIIG
ncbi:hypothetical protein GCM10009039_27810 [Halocalculus aciditolerans]|uniref:Uncharacterized protein n=1 Tax=Halocalculus aciditolerans TaxID=1383812 RepID=A0A830FEX0_9EURY|nr:hypothetical protein GCM10009039_27810 [Halocalculus aciditolerans]